jgi:hypothetical protein
MLIGEKLHGMILCVSLNVRTYAFFHSFRGFVKTTISETLDLDIAAFQLLQKVIIIK